MKLRATLSILIILSVVLTFSVLSVASQDDGGVDSPSSIQAPVGTSITYQGRLEDNGTNANGQYDLQFILYDAVVGGLQIGSVVTKADVIVADGLFTTVLDFGGDAFTGEERYLEIRVRPGASSGGYETLSPRQALTAVPFALNIQNPNAKMVAGSLNTGNIVSNGITTNEIIINNSIGIGKSPVAALDVKANSTTASGWNEAIRLGPSSHAAITHPGGGLLFGLHGINRTFYFADTKNGVAKYIMTINANNGRVAIGTVNPGAMLHVAGDAILAGTTQTNILQINGGSDLSESFDINTATEIDPEPGMVVCIDPQNPGKLVVCDKAYDFTIAGAISGAGGINPGMVMGQEGSIAAGEHPVALTGRVYVQVDASYGAVQPGDLLTTSNTPGHAMKVTNSEQAQGAILGKAMTSLDSGTGLVLVLVSLQ